MNTLRITRRNFIRMATYWTMLYVTWSNIKLPTQHPEIRRTELKLSEGGLSMRVVTISDLHFHDSNRNIIEKTFKIITQIKPKPDLICIVWDIVHKGELAYLNDNIDLFSLLKWEPIIFTLWNHDYFEDSQSIMKAIKDLGFDILNNEYTVLNINWEQVTIIWVWSDMMGDRKKITSIITETQLKKNRTILLTHEPIGFNDAIWNNIDVAFAWHTHWSSKALLRFMDKHGFTKWDADYNSGLYVINRNITNQKWKITYLLTTPWIWWYVIDWFNCFTIRSHVPTIELINIT